MPYNPNPEMTPSNLGFIREIADKVEQRFVECGRPAKVVSIAVCVVRDDGTGYSTGRYYGADDTKWQTQGDMADLLRNVSERLHSAVENYKTTLPTDDDEVD